MATASASSKMQPEYMKYFVRKFPEKEDDENYICQAEDCFEVKKGGNRTNLRTHLKTRHPNFYKKHISNLMLDRKTIAIKRLRFIQCCTEIVTANCRAFNSLNDSGFKKLVSDQVNELKENGCGDGLSAPAYTAVKEYAVHLASRIEAQIKAEVRDKFVSLMVDTATKNRKSILGLSLQYLLDGKIVIRSIGMIPLHVSHTGKNLLSIITERLKRFGIKMTQVIAITSDNASNMEKMVNLFNQYCDETGAAFDFDETADDFLGEDGADPEQCDDIDAIEKALLDLEVDNDLIEDELESVLNGASNFQSLLENLGNLFALKNLKIAGIRCAAHTVQLAVKSALKEKRFATLMAICRLACKEFKKASN